MTIPVGLRVKRKDTERETCPRWPIRTKMSVARVGATGSGRGGCVLLGEARQIDHLGNKDVLVL